MQASSSGHDYEVKLFAAFFLLGAAILFTTSVGAITAVVIWIVAWFFGRPATIAIPALTIGASATAWLVIHGDYSSFIPALWYSYYDAPLRASGVVWLRAVLDNSAWLLLSPPGLICGAVLVFAHADYKKSRIRALTGDGAPPKETPSPWARFVIPRICRGPASHRNAVVIGADAVTGSRVTITDHELNRHTVVVGRSGQGKTTTLLNIVEYAIMRGIPTVFVDGKGDRPLGDRICNFARANGRAAYLFDAHDTATSCFYDPLAHKNYTVRANCLIELRDNWSEEHFKLLSMEKMQTTLRVLETLGIECDLTTIPGFMNSTTLLALVRRHGQQRSDQQDLADAILKMNDGEEVALGSLRASITNLTNANFGLLFDMKLARKLDKPVLDLLSARRQNAVAYFGLPALVFPETARRLAALIINDLKATVAAQSSPYLLVFDELSIAGPQLTTLINQGRTYGVCGVLGSQCFADFELPAHPQFIRQVVGSANNFIFHELTDPVDAELAASMIGTSPSVGHTAQMVGEQPTGASSARSVREFKIHPDRLKNIGTGEAYLLNKDRQTIVPRVKIRKGII